MAGKIHREEIPWYPTIHEDLCTGCDKCLEFCPNGVFQSKNGGISVIKPYGCVVGCSECTKICPAEAIEFPDQEEFMRLLKTLRKQARARG